MAGLEVEGLFTAALGLQAPWSVQKVDLNAAKEKLWGQVLHEHIALS